MRKKLNHGRSRMHWEKDAEGRVWCCVKFRAGIKRRGKRMAYWYAPKDDRMLWSTPQSSLMAQVA